MSDRIKEISGNRKLEHSPVSTRKDIRNNHCNLKFNYSTYFKVIRYTAIRDTVVILNNTNSVYVLNILYIDVPVISFFMV